MSNLTKQNSNPFCTVVYIDIENEEMCHDLTADNITP